MSNSFVNSKYFLFFISLIFLFSSVSSSIESSGTVSSQISKEKIALDCKVTLYQELCEASLTSFAETIMESPTQTFDLSVQFAANQIHSTRNMAYNLSVSGKNSHPNLPPAIDDCIELLDDSLWLLEGILDIHKKPTHDDVMTWLSAALTNQETCLESLQSDKSSPGRDIMEAKSQTLSQYISISLALCASIRGNEENSNVNSVSWKSLRGEFPSWVSTKDRKLLDTSPKKLEANAIVAKDGSGTHISISEAIEAVSLAVAGNGRSVIYVKAGTYKENIRIPTKQRNVMLVGDGKGKTVITSNRNAEDGWTTFQSATVAASGEGFIARDLTIVNAAGPSKHQAVALRVGADKAVVYRVSIIGYQDTLYAHKNRQFYRENDIYGTVDFIFGNAAAVFQSCNLSPRRPLGGQRNSITAQGRIDSNQNTGFSIHQCKISASSDLAPVKHSVATYLGRPWHPYSRTVIMESYLDDSIHAAGWEEWSGEFGLKTLYYGEYKNSGPGSSISGRVKWPGIHSSLSSAEASRFTVANFIYGNSWLPSTGVPFIAGLGA